MAKLWIDMRGTSQTKKSLNSIPTKISAAQREDVYNTVLDGQRYARSVAPHYTGATKAAILASGDTLSLVEPRQARSDPRPYHMWMHGIPSTYRTKSGESGTINPAQFIASLKSGKGYFMYDAAGYMQRRINERLAQRFKKGA